MAIVAPDPITASRSDPIVISTTALRQSGAETLLDVALPHPPAACRLEISGRPVCAAGRDLGIDAFVNGWWIGYWRFEGQETVTLLAEIEAEFVRPTPSGSLLNIAFRVTDCPTHPPLTEPGRFEFAAIVFSTDTPTSDIDADRAGPDIGQDLADPGVCLMCLDETLPPEIDGAWYTFRLQRPAREVMLWSRSAIPAELGAADDLRRLGIAVSCIDVGGKMVPLDHWSLGAGWQPMEAGWRWTNGAARLLLPDGATVVRVQVAATLAQYQPDAASMFSFEDVIGVFVLPGRIVIRMDGHLPADKVKPLLRSSSGHSQALHPTRRWTKAEALRPETSLVMAVDLSSLPLSPDLCLEVWIEDYLLYQQDFRHGQTLTGRIEGVRDYCLTGWVAHLHGEAVPPLELLLDGEIVADAAIAVTRHDLNHQVPPPACIGYRIPLPARALDGAVHDIRLRGNDMSLDLVWQARPRFRIEESSDGAVSGWFYDAAMRDEPVTISVCRDGAVLHKTPTTAQGGSKPRNGRAQTGFSAGIPAASRACVGTASLELRAGRAAQLVFASLFPRTPVTAAGALRRVAGQLLQVERMLGLETAWSRDRLSELRSQRELGRTVRPGLQVAAHFPPGDVSVVVPVYKGVADTRACLDSLAEAVRTGNSGIGEIILVDDCSPDPAMAGVLRDHADRVLFKRLGVTVRVLRNRGNLGFVASVNAGVAAALPNNDILLLNSDTIVPVGFASRMQAAAYGRPDIASVSPLSNDATILSLPDRTGGNALPPDLLAALNGFLQARGGDRAVDIPVGVGFCILLKRAALADVGGFGVEWGRGYCEEVDWCLRARDRGWTHAAAVDTFVYHRGSVSFGSDERTRILERNHALLEQRYPDYVGDLKAFMVDDPLQALRTRCVLPAAPPGRPALRGSLHPQDGRRHRQAGGKPGRAGRGGRRRQPGLCAGQRRLARRALLRGTLARAQPDPAPAPGIDHRFHACPGATGPARNGVGGAFADRGRVRHLCRGRGDELALCRLCARLPMVLPARRAGRPD